MRPWPPAHRRASTPVARSQVERAAGMTLDAALDGHEAQGSVTGMAARATPIAWASDDHVASGTLGRMSEPAHAQPDEQGYVQLLLPGVGTETFFVDGPDEQGHFHLIPVGPYEKIP